MCQCAGCAAMHQGLGAAALPAGWDALLLPGAGWAFWCGGCVAAGLMESERAYRGLPRRGDWRMPDAIMAFYRPAAREVLVGFPGGQAVLREADAERLCAALAAALAVRDTAMAVCGEKAALRSFRSRTQHAPDPLPGA